MPPPPAARSLMLLLALSPLLSAPPAAAGPDPEPPAAPTGAEASPVEPSHPRTLAPSLAPAPTAPVETVATVAGVRILINGCTALDVHEGPPDLDLLSLRWTRPASRSDWLQHEFDRALRPFEGDLWRAFVELGGGLRQTAGGVVVEARATDTVLACGSFELPVLDVEAVLGVYDVRDDRRLGEAARPLVAAGLDPGDPELGRLLQAGRAAENGAGASLELPVEGVTDRTLGCPPWALIDASVDFDCGSTYGFVDVRYGSPDLEPTAEQALAFFLARLGLTDIDELGTTEAADLEERADRLARRGPYRYRGHFTGEITLYRTTEAVFLTPVFEAEALLEAPWSPGEPEPTP